MDNTTIVPIFDPNREWRLWNISELFGHSINGKYVPNVDDLVMDLAYGFYQVTFINLGTGESSLTPWVANSEIKESDNSLIGVDLTPQAESFRLYIDKSVTPYTMACDARLHVFGSTNSHIKVFKGNNISSSGAVISAMYNPYGDFLGENIPLELVATDNLNNLSIKTPAVGFTMSDISDGEPVTVVVYDELGYVVSYNKLLVKNTSFIRSSEASTKYVTSVRLDSPFLDKSDERVLKFPMNMSLEDFPAQAVITYSDGEKVYLPINSEYVNLFGLDQFISTVEGQKVPLVLSYYLKNEEYAYSGAVGDKYHISEKYWAMTTEFEKSYSLKMFMYPEWVDEIEGYKLNFFLMNLDRGVIYNVTSLAKPTSHSSVFNPLSYGSKQNLSYFVEMDKVAPKYSKYKFIQSFNLTLLDAGNRDKPRWFVNVTNSQKIAFGSDLKAKIKVINTDLSHLDISNGFNSVDEWLTNVFYVTEPIHNPLSEVASPKPNILLIRTKRREFETTIDDWNNNISIINDLSNGENITIEFIHRIYENDLKLGVIQLPVTLI